LHHELTVGFDILLNGISRGEFNMLSWTNAKRMGHRLLSATLRCRQCSRPAGELVGFADRSLGEARFLPLDTGFMPHNLAGDLRCGVARANSF
jgi:hypothetical protein